MNFLGKLIGFIVGWRFGGFFGGLFGAFLGHLADKKLYELGSVKSSFFGHSITRQALFMQTTFAVLGHLSKSKGRVTEEDIQLATQLMEQMHLDDANRKLAQSAFNRGKQADFPIRQVMREFRLGCGQRADLLRMFLDIQIQAALADQVLQESEKEILFTIAGELGISAAQFERMLSMIYASRQFASGFYRQQQHYQQQGYQQQDYQKGQYRQSYHSNSSGPTLDDAYKVLGVSANDDKKTVRRAYLRLMNEYHPDKLVAKGMPEQMMEMAKEKAQRIQAAYDLICKVKGW